MKILRAREARASITAEDPDPSMPEVVRSVDLRLESQVCSNVSSHTYCGNIYHLVERGCLPWRDCVP